jgi:hypothetical protein
VHPAFVFETATDVMLVPLSWNSDEAHERAKTLVRAISAAYDVPRITMISEAWVASYDTPDPEVRPMDSERRQEAVCVASAYRKGDEVKLEMTMRCIERNDDGSFRALVADAGKGMPHGESWLTSAVLRKPLRPYARATLRAVLRGVGFGQIEVPQSH